MSGGVARVSNHPHQKNGDNCITLLARDPNWLYVYWDIPAEKSAAFSAELGEELWKRSVPALKVSNITRNESFFVRINEFSDNWYINVQDSNNLYMVEIGRKISENYFISMSGSNGVVTPSDYVSPDTTACFVNYADLKNGRFEFRTDKARDSFIYDYAAEGISGLSSPGLYGADWEEAFSGESSAAFYGKNPPELPGTGPEGFMKG
jgi:hypothetical protein